MASDLPGGKLVLHDSTWGRARSACQTFLWGGFGCKTPYHFMFLQIVYVAGSRSFSWHSCSQRVYACRRSSVLERSTSTLIATVRRESIGEAQWWLRTRRLWPGIQAREKLLYGCSVGHGVIRSRLSQPTPIGDVGARDQRTSLGASGFYPGQRPPDG